MEAWLNLIGFVFGYAVVCIWMIVVAIYLYIQPSRRVDRNLPGPKRHFLLGVTFGETSDIFQEGEGFNWGKWPTLSLVLGRRYNYQTWGGPSINIGFGPAFFNVVNPTCLKYILKDNFENYVKGKLTKSFDDLMGEAVFTSDGDLWKFHRKIVVSLLSRETVEYASNLLLAKLGEVETFLFGKQDQEVDFQDLANRMIFDVFCQLQFGVDFDQIIRDHRDEDSPPRISSFNIKQRQIEAFIKAFNDLQYYTHLRFNDFFWQIKQKWCLGERERKILECKGVIDEFCWSVINQAKNQKDLTGREDVVSKFIRYSKDRTEKEPSAKEIRDFTMTLIMAGRDTTAAALSWITWELERHPQVLFKLRQEVDKVCKGEDFCMEKVESIEYLRAVVMEGLRLHSPVPDTYRFAVKDDTLPDGTFIPAGSLVMYSPYTINHCETVWENPDIFDPERWMGKGNPNSFSFPVFNAGPRICPGRNLALMELKTSVAYLTSKFDFVNEKKHSGDYHWTLVMSMKDGFPVIVRNRQPNRSAV